MKCGQRMTVSEVAELGIGPCIFLPTPPTAGCYVSAERFKLAEAQPAAEVVGEKRTTKDFGAVIRRKIETNHKLCIEMYDTAMEEVAELSSTNSTLQSKCEQLEKQLEREQQEHCETIT